MFLKRATRRFLLASQLRGNNSYQYHHFYASAAALSLGSFYLNQNSAEAEDQEEAPVQEPIQIPEEP